MRNPVQSVAQLGLGLAVCLALAGSAAAEEAPLTSRYGPDDRLGALNQLSPELALRAAKLVTAGKTYSLAVPMGPDTPAYGTRSYRIVTTASGDGSGTPLGSNALTSHDDLLITWLGIGTQLDGLGHIGIGHRYYNGLSAGEVLRPDGIAELSIDRLPPIATRGVLLDAAGHRGVEQLPAGTALGPEELGAIAEKQGVEIGAGDVVLIHTGWLARAGDRDAFLAGEPGLSKAAARELAARGVVAVGADSWGLEPIPFEDPQEVFPVHQILLAENGVYILENVQTAELAADRAYEFLFVLGAPRFQGAVQAPVHPVAIR